MPHPRRTLRRAGIATAVGGAIAAATLATLSAPAGAQARCSNAQVRKLDQLQRDIGTDRFWFDYYDAAVESDTAHLDEATARGDYPDIDQFRDERNDDLYWRDVVWGQQLHDDQQEYDDLDLDCAKQN